MTDIQFDVALADYALDTSVALLDALLDSASAARPGVDADHYATELARLARESAVAAADISFVIADQPAPDFGAASVAPPAAAVAAA